MRPVVWSYGGGTQSVAIAVLVAQGKLPRPEVCVIADTGREATETWEYTDAHVRPLLRSVGVEVEVAGHDLAGVDLYAGNGDLLIPAYTADGKLPTFCSDKWKARVVARFLKGKGYGPKNPVLMWMGMSLDEIGRMKQGGAPWIEKTWPLVFNDLGRRFAREDCRLLVERAGLPTPPKSSCWMCPFRRNSQWRRLRDEYPRDFRRAVALDEAIRERDEKNDVYVHRDAVPLKDADLSEKDRPQDPLFGELEDCDSGYCMV